MSVDIEIAANARRRLNRIGKLQVSARVRARGSVEKSYTRPRQAF
jgi:hypothetical protein